VSPHALIRFFVVYAVALSIACAVLRAVIYLDPHAAPSQKRIVSVWRGGQRIAQRVVTSDPRSVLMPACPGCLRIVERVVDEGPLISFTPWLLAASLVSGRDGYSVELGGRKLYVTPSDLLARQASPGTRDGRPRKIRLGLDDPSGELALVAAELGSDAETLLAQGRFRRFLVRREDGAQPWPARITAGELDVPKLRAAAEAAAEYLARNQHSDGTFVYELLPTNGHEQPGYNWPRHGGTTLFLAEVAAWTGNPDARRAAVAAAKLVTSSRTLSCGQHSCIGDTPRVDVGSSALALLSYVELYEAGAAPELRQPIERLASFLRSQQRPDGELMHEYDREAGRRIDVQYPYYTGEAAYALSRAHRVTGKPEDLRAASAALAYLVDAWDFVGSRYMFNAEHWTCQALEDLWDRAPNREALRFCLDYQSFNARFQLGPECELGAYDGGIAQIPVFPPRLTGTASRVEAGIATLATAIAARSEPAVIARVEGQLRRALAFMMRFQFLPGPSHIFADPLRPLGGIPGSPTELNIRIDYPQHAAGAMLRYAQLLERRAGAVAKASH